jgi:hypothetical protein
VCALVGGVLMAIIGICGPPGTGKSYELVRQAYRAVCQGRDVYTNFRFWYPMAVTMALVRRDVRAKSRADALKVMGRWRPVVSWEQLESIREGVFCFDETHTWAYARAWSELPWEMFRWWSQSRKYKVDVYWATQRWEAVDAMLREVVHERWRACRMFGLFWYRREDPAAEKREARLGWRWSRFDPVIASLYDTLEILKPPAWRARDAKKRKHEDPQGEKLSGRPRPYPARPPVSLVARRSLVGSGR